MRRQFPLFATTVALLLGSWNAAATADFLPNGGFSDGLTGYVANDPALIDVVNGVAVIRESAIDSEVDLSRDFQVPAGAKTLSFTLVGLGLESESGAPPDAFGASLVDPSSLVSLVPTVDAFTDSFYIRDLTIGTASGQVALGVSLAPGAESLPLRITLDLTGLEGRDVRLLFRVIGAGMLSNASVSIDDIAIDAGAVPEPYSISLLAVGLTLLAGSRARRRKAC